GGRETQRVPVAGRGRRRGGAAGANAEGGGTDQTSHRCDRPPRLQGNHGKYSGWMGYLGGRGGRSFEGERTSRIKLGAGDDGRWEPRPGDHRGIEASLPLRHAFA